jgi:hypothetical protein
MTVAKKILLFLTQIFCVVFFAQSEKIDSLKKLLDTETKEDTTRVDRLFYLSGFYIYDKPDSGIYYADSALRLSKKLGYTIGEAWANYNLGEANWVLGDYALSMQYFLQAMDLFKQMKRLIGVSTMKYCIGDIYEEMSDYKQALQYYFEARKMDEENPDDLKLLLPDIPMKKRLIVNDLSIAESYLVGNMLDSALFFAKRGFIKDRELEDWTYPALVLGNVYFKRNQLDSALYYYRSTFKETAQNDRIDIHNGIAAIFRERNQRDSCRYYAKMAWDTAQLIRYRKGALQSSELLAWSYEKINPVKTIRYYKISTAIKDSLYDREKLSRVDFLVFSEKLKEQELQATQEKYQNRLKMYGLLIVVAFSLLIALLLWRSNRHRQKAYALLQKQAENELQIQKLESERTKAEFQRQATELELQALRAQMNPHFIFNCLNSINRFIIKNDAAKAADYLTKFAKLIRIVLQQSGKPFIPLEDELKYLQLYMDLEALRFEKPFTYEINCDGIDTSSVMIPTLLIQPFVENAIRHGLHAKANGNGAINININLQGDILHCKICDNGIGRAAAIIKEETGKKSMGINLTQHRLQLIDPAKQERVGIKIHDLINDSGHNAGTCVDIKIPVKTI